MFIQNILENNPQLKEQWHSGIEEIQSNQRLRIGFWLILGITLFYIGFIVSENRNELEKQIIQAKQRESKALHLAKETIWLDRSNDLQNKFAQLQLKFNSASTAGIAKATLQGLMNEMVKNSALEKANIRVEDAEIIQHGVSIWTFVVSVDSVLDGFKAEDFLFELSQHPYHLMVENIDLLPNIKRFRIRLKYWFANELELEEIKKVAKQKVNNSSKKSLKDDMEEAIKQGVPSELFN